VSESVGVGVNAGINFGSAPSFVNLALALGWVLIWIWNKIGIWIWICLFF
jgi:hypothetical protein